MHKDYDFSILTPCFCHGADMELCEIRVPSIRGHLRRWHEVLYGHEDMIASWGAAENGTAIASKVILRLMALKDGTAPQQVLPHVRSGSKAFSRQALAAGNQYRLMVSFRPLTDEAMKNKVHQVILTWLYLGTVGMRSSRAFGSVWPLAPQAPQSSADLRKVLTPLITKWAVAISDKPLTSVNMAYCTDTLSGSINEKYFGYVHDSQRMTSPLKMKYVRLGNDFHLLLQAMDRSVVSGALQQLKAANKPIGNMTFEYF